MYPRTYVDTYADANVDTYVLTYVSTSALFVSTKKNNHPYKIVSVIRQSSIQWDNYREQELNPSSMLF